MQGVVNLDKPMGPTSHDMVALLRRLTGIRRIGHAGTLDPLASGVLPILVGTATRFSRDLSAGDKRYNAVVRLGWRSKTDDAQGPIELGGAPPADDHAISAALQAFVGTISQKPPAFSALKVGGRSAHHLARGGQAVDLAPRNVTVHAIDVLGIERAADHVDVHIDIRCGPGTYVRSIARDLGEELGSGGYLAALRRTAVGRLRVEDAITPERLESLAAEGHLDKALIGVGELLVLPEVRLDAAAAHRFSHGSAVALSGHQAGRHAVQHDGTLLGIGRIDDGVLKPETVIAADSA